MSTSSTTAAPSLGSPPSEKLTRDNYMLWKALVLPALRGAQMTGLLDGKEAAPAEMVLVMVEGKETGTAPNLAYDTWLSRDQQVLSYLLQSMSKEIQLHVLDKPHAADIWKTITDMFASQARAKVTNLRIALGNTKKREMTTDAFISKMKGFGKELAAAGKPVDEEEMVSFIIAGLDGHYDSVVAAINAMPDSTMVTVSHFYTQLKNYERRQEMLADDAGAGEVN